MFEFDIDDLVVCISDRLPCCDKKMIDHPPVVGEIYKVIDHMVGTCLTCGYRLLSFVSEYNPDHLCWPEYCFKRIPPKVDIKSKTVKEPVLEDV